MSPVKWRLMSSIGASWVCPPPVPPPFTPNTGPSDGSRIATIARFPSRRSPSARPIVVVDLPSPAGVGVIAVTRTSAPSGRALARSIASQRIFALELPYGSRSPPFNPRASPIAWIGWSFTARAISMSCFPIARSSGRSLRARRRRPEEGLRTNRERGDLHAEMADGVGDRVGDRRRRADRPSLAHPLHAPGRHGRRRLQMTDLEQGQIVGLGKRIVHERRGEEVAVTVVHDALEERLPDALRDGAVDLAFDDHRIDHGPAVLDQRVALHGDAPRGWVDLD